MEGECISNDEQVQLYDVLDSVCNSVFFEGQVQFGKPEQNVMR